MNDVQVKCFLEAAQQENFTKAAERLYMAQPALSRNIASLEQEIGAQLFIRERKSVRLSEAGRICFEGFSKMRGDYEEMRSLALAAQRNLTGALLLGTAEGQLVGEAYAPAFRKLFTDCPNIDFRLSFHSLSALKAALLNGGIDMAIIAESLLEDIRDEVDYRPVRKCESCLVVPANHPKAELKDPSIEDFMDETFLTLDIRESKNLLGHRLRQDRLGDRMKFKVAPDIGTLALWLESGMGISMLNSWHSLKNSPKLRFIRVRESEFVTEVAEVVAWNRSNPNPAIRIFLDILDQVTPGETKEQ